MSGIHFHVSQTNTITLDKMLDGLDPKGSDSLDGESLRLHNKKEKKHDYSENNRLNIHTKTSVKIFFGKSKTEHHGKRQAAVDLVKQAVMREFECSGHMAVTIMQRAGQRGNGITLGQLKLIKESAKSPEKLNVAEGLLRVALDRPSEERAQIVKDACVKALGLGSRSLANKFLNENAIKDQPTLLDLRKKAYHGDIKVKQEVLQALKDIKSGLEDEQVQDIINKAEKDHGQCLVKALIGQVEETMSEVSKMITEKELSKTGSSRLKHWENLGNSKLTGGTLSLETFQKEGIEDLLKRPSQNWKGSSSGTSGAIIIHGDKPHEGVVLKFDSEKSVESCVKVSNYISSVVSSLGQKKARFEGMVVSGVNISNHKKVLEERIEEMGNNNKTPRTEEVVKKGKLALQSNASVMKCGFVPNATALDQLSTVDKIVLCKGNLLPRQLGQAMILTRLFGQSDHVGILPQDTNIDKFSSGLTNLPNMMINNENGNLVFIDYNLNPEPPDKLKLAYSTLGKFVGMSIDPNNVQQSLARLVKDPKYLRSLTDGVFEPSSASGLFKEAEASALESVSDTDKERFIANVMLGVIDAMKLIRENPEAFISKDAPIEDSEGVVKKISEISEGLDKVETLLRDYVKKNGPKM